MVEISRYDFYDVLSFTDWKNGTQIGREVASYKGFKDPEEVQGLRKLYWLWKKSNVTEVTYPYLHQLVGEGLAEHKIMPPTDEEVAKYTNWNLSEESRVWEGRRVFRKSPTGKRTPQGDYEGLESLLPA